MSTDRIERGIEILEQLRPGGAKNVQKGYQDIAPDMADNILGYIFGDLYGRPGFDLKSKQMMTITALAVLGYAKPQLAYHIENGLNVGLSRDDIINILIHVSGYAGFPAALTGLSTAREVFDKLDGKAKS
jgi:4-carboxymuconolactone decarboxylase